MNNRNSNVSNLIFNQMRMFVLAVFFIIFIFSLTACGNDNKDNKNSNSNGVAISDVDNVDVVIKNELTVSTILISCTLNGNTVTLPASGVNFGSSLELIESARLVKLFGDGKLVCTGNDGNLYHGWYRFVNGEHIFTFDNRSGRWGTPISDSPHIYIEKNDLDFSLVNCTANILETNNSYELKMTLHHDGGVAIYEFASINSMSSADKVFGNTVNVACNGKGLETTKFSFVMQDLDPLHPYIAVDLN